ncbi:hypothetical protein, conserved in T. vivax [Trypanosoma vivax Y486]|uniref:Uncharacterized protein n=1 Tax=Trypanosoma vivax (strain Y486) TaxID=1055687 RepID=F9WMV6_TRYVY|nr:hypothetical protein, conserved in T. vivax [Trypanosoma vivax Y486]|eukprot:CCD18871.1 hypothetical protein, conserved in T. vivax [Trypanosoma vivax Y486]
MVAWHLLLLAATSLLHRELAEGAGYAKGLKQQEATDACEGIKTLLLVDAAAEVLAKEAETKATAAKGWLEALTSVAHTWSPVAAAEDTGEANSTVWLEQARAATTVLERAVKAALLSSSVRRRAHTAAMRRHDTLRLFGSFVSKATTPQYGISTRSGDSTGDQDGWEQVIKGECGADEPKPADSQAANTLANTGRINVSDGNEDLATKHIKKPGTFDLQGTGVTLTGVNAWALGAQASGADIPGFKTPLKKYTWHGEWDMTLALQASSTNTALAWTSKTNTDTEKLVHDFEALRKLVHGSENSMKSACSQHKALCEDAPSDDQKDKMLSRAKAHAKNSAAKKGSTAQGQKRNDEEQGNADSGPEKHAQTHGVEGSREALLCTGQGGRWDAETHKCTKQTHNAKESATSKRLTSGLARLAATWAALAGPRE